ncbi:unnamed protein product [Peronospora effusa]|nr:unnamed protein product [Peronospora effusa]
MEFTKLRKMQGLNFSVCDTVLVATGRRAFTAGLGLKQMDIQTDKLGCIKDDDAVRTQGIACVENITSKHGHIKYTVLFLVTSARIQSSIRGQYGGGAKADVVEYNVGTFLMMANICARTVAESDGMVMVLADTKTDKMDSRAHHCHVMPDPGRTCHAHPTLSEAFQESCVAAFDKSITF